MLWKDLARSLLQRPDNLPAYPGSQDDAQSIEIGSKSRQHRRGWADREGLDWPIVPETGENYHVSHVIAKADGGADTLDNIEPEHPKEHIERHRANGDFSRWALRRGRPKTSPPKGGPAVRGLGVLGIIPNITGVLAGRIRMDTFDNFWSDMLGFPSEEDQRKAFEDHQRLLNPKWKPGDPFIT